MRLVQDWKSAWRWWSVRGALAIAALPWVWISLPPDVKAMLPVNWEPWVLTAIALATAIGRIKDQSK